MAKVSTSQLVHVVGAFVVWGPLIATGIIWVLLIVLGGPALFFERGQTLLEGLGSTVGFALVSLLVGYGVGIVPAFATGFISLVLAGSVRRDLMWILACSGVGAVAGGVTGTVMTYGPSLETAILAASSGVAAGGCGWILRRSRTG